MLIDATRVILTGEDVMAKLFSSASSQSVTVQYTFDSCRGRSVHEDDREKDRYKVKDQQIREEVLPDSTFYQTSDEFE